jgi:hypothetical protein
MFLKVEAMMAIIQEIKETNRSCWQNPNVSGCYKRSVNECGEFLVLDLTVLLTLMAVFINNV